MSTMTLQGIPTCLQIPWVQKGKLLPADALNLKTIAAGGTTNAQAAPTKIIAIIACSNDTVPHDIQIGILDATAGFFPIGTVTVQLGSGYAAGAPSVSLLNSIVGLPLDDTGQPYLFIQPTDLIQVKCMVAAVSAGKEVDFVVQGADF
jgi:hypothetical protein